VVVTIAQVRPSLTRRSDVLAYDYPLLAIILTIQVLFLVVIVGFVVIYTFIDNFRRTDHGGFAKAGWALLIVLLPLVGAIVYIATRPEMQNPPPPSSPPMDPPSQFAV